jgi:acetyltransferase
MLDLADEAALTRAIDAMQARVRRALPQARLDGFTVQGMARLPHAHELIVGVSTDPLFGPVILFGQGGVAVEVSADRAIALPPLNRVLAADMVGRTRVARQLAGFRDVPPVRIEALYDVLVRIGQLVADVPELVELDINPLLAWKDGVVALDARMRLSPVAPGVDPLARLAILPYPQELERRVDSALGLLTLRPIRPEDAQAHQDFFHALSPEDVHFRMFGQMRDLSAGQLARFTQIDYAREMAFIATRPKGGKDETLGVARVVIDPDNVEGEFAIVVRSDLKGKGLGKLLMTRLLDYCRARGLRLVRGTALPENTGMHALARRCGFDVGQAAEGTVAMGLDLLAGEAG